MWTYAGTQSSSLQATCSPACSAVLWRSLSSVSWRTNFDCLYTRSQRTVIIRWGFLPHYLAVNFSLCTVRWQRSMYKLPRLSVCVSVFRISQKRFPWNFLWFIGVIGRRERIKTSGKFRPLMCKNWENGAKWPILRKSPRATLACAMACGPSSRARLRAGLRSDFGTGQSRTGLGAWPVAFDGRPYRTLLCSWVKFSRPTFRPAFGRVNASNVCYTCKATANILALL